MRTAIAIGGLDPSSGAGIIADARAIRAAGAWPGAVCAVLTVQSTRGLVRAVPVDSKLVAAQLRELFDDLDVRALKSGALGSTANARALARVAAEHPRVPLVVDPVLSPSRGRGTLNLDLRALLPHAALLTPNIPEAERLLGAEIRTAHDARDAAAALLDLGPAAVLLKGGHLRGRTITDFLATRRRIHTIGRRRILAGREIHGTGCALASLIAGRLAALGARVKLSDDALMATVRWATMTLSQWLRTSQRIGSTMLVLGPRR